MLIKRNKLLALILLLICVATTKKTQAQSGTAKDYTKYPYWKDMINDPNTNYFEVQKAFNLFWEGKEMPLEEDDIMNEKEEKLKNNFVNRVFKSKELKEQQEQMELEALAFDIKKYRRWLIQTEPYIHDDGSIMSDEEKLALWRKHYEELNRD